jgi:Domain of unknown function (DUF3883)
MSFKEKIEELIRDKKEKYRKYPGDIINDFKRETEIKQDYAGRQILELLQNADDVNASEVLFQLVNNVPQPYLLIANKGDKAFSESGIASLMTPNNSSKPPGQNFIGNKGLGFRSVLNWASEIHIVTDKCCVRFSKEMAKQAFQTFQVPKSSRVGYADDAVLLAMLAIPSIDDAPEDTEWKTQIKLFYQPDKETSIQAQLNTFQAETLLFLRYIQKVTIQIAQQKSVYSKALSEKHYITLVQPNKTTTWQLKELEEKCLPDVLKNPILKDPERFTLKIAFQEPFYYGDYCVFNFFPTKVPFPLPYILHGTFDLDSSRNSLHPNEKNQYIFKELCSFLRDIAVEMTQKSHSWDAFCLLTPPSFDSKDEPMKTFYDGLQNIVKTLPIYPCIDGQYRKWDEVKFYTKDFSNWVYEKGYSSDFPALIQLPEMASIQQLILKSIQESPQKQYSEVAFQQKINDLSRKINLLESRVELIGHFMELKITTNLKYDLYINEQAAVVSSEHIAYTPILSEAKTFAIPSFAKIDFIQNLLYQKLSEIHKSKKDWQKSDNPARDFKNYFSKYCNIQDYDSKAVIERIIVATKEHLKEKTIEDQRNMIKEMVKTLFENFSNLKNKNEKFSKEAPLLDEAGNKKQSNELFLGKTYPSGAIMADIYGNHLTDHDYLMQESFWELPTDDKKVIEDFFIWLGVHRHLKMVEIKENTYSIYSVGRIHDYLNNYVFKKIARPNPNTYYSMWVDSIENIHFIKQLTLEQQILFIYTAPKLYDALDMSNDDELHSHYGNRNPALIQSKPSYISFQLSQIINVQDYWVETHIPFLQHAINLDFKHPLFLKYDLKEDVIKAILIQLGAKKHFSELSEARVCEILQQLSEKEVEHKYCRPIYELALEYFKERKEHLTLPNLHLLSIRAGKKAYRPHSEVYYNDHLTLPSKILNKYALFDFPKRRGEGQIGRILGTQSFKGKRLTCSDAISYAYQNDFQDWFDQIKPFILAYRIQGLTKDKSEIAQKLKNCQILLVEKAFYQFEGESESLELYDAVQDEAKKRMIRVEANQSLDMLKQNPQFCEAFASLICLLFEVNEQKDLYSNCVKDSIAYTTYMLREQSEILEEARQLLGIASKERQFWEAVFQIKGLKMEGTLENLAKLKQIVKNKLQLEWSETDTSEDLHRCERASTIELLKKLEQLGISPERLHQQNKAFGCLKSWHKTQFKAATDDLEESFKRNLWLKLRDCPQKQVVFVPKQYDYKQFCAEKAQNWADEYSFILNVAHRAELQAALVEQYEISMEPQEIEIRRHYLDSVPETFWSELTHEEQSLYFFEGNEQRIKINPTISTLPIEIPIELSSGEVKIGGTIEFVAAPPTYSGGGSQSPATYNPKTTRQQVRAGKRAEALVHKKLCADGYIVKWVSGSNDGSQIGDDTLGYDFKYKKAEADPFDLLEVKSFSNNSFIMTAHELEVGFREKEKYHLALVKEDTIYWVKDFFKQERSRIAFEKLKSADFMRALNVVIYFKCES